MTGKTIAHYSILEKLGEGGMGEVYRVRDSRLNREVALKVLPEGFAKDVERMARFQREAQVLASLNHPNIAAIHGLEESSGIRALVIELVEGPTVNVIAFQELTARDFHNLRRNERESPTGSHAEKKDRYRHKIARARMNRLLLLAALSFLPTHAVSQNQEALQHANRGFQLAQDGDLKEAEKELRRAVDLAPIEPQFLAGLGGVLGMLQKLQEAQIYLERALKLDPQNLTFRRNLAANEWQLGRLPSAKENLEQILRLKPGDEPTVLLLGMVMENLQDYTRAAALLGSVPALVKQRPESLTALARAYFRTGKREKARATLEILQHHPAGASGVFMGARVAAEVGDYETAERLFASIQTSYSDPLILGYRLALVRYRSGKFREGQETLESLISAGHVSSEICNLLGWCYQKQGKSKEMQQAFQQAIQLDPLKESNYLDLAMILAGARQLAAALVVSKENVERHPGSYHAHVMKGLIELKMDQFTDAIQSYGRAVELDPSSAEAYRGLAAAQFAAGMITEAKSTFEATLQRFSHDSLQYQEYGKLLLKLGETGDSAAESRGIQLLEAALKLDGSLSEPHYYLGNLAMKRGKIEEAAKHLEEATRLDPKGSRNYYALARAYRRLGRSGDAERQFQRYRELKAEEENGSNFVDFLRDNSGEQEPR